MKILVLLVGGNPISNYGITKHSLQNDKNHKILPKFDKIALVYTDSSKQNADNFKKLLSSQVSFIDINIKDKARSLGDVEKIIKSNLENEEIDFIHLNYTGGTKSMSIGAYLAVDSLDVKEKVFSDIGMDKKLYLKRGDVYPENGTIIDTIEIRIDEILALNNINATYSKEYSKFYNKEFARFLLDKSINDVESFFKNLWDKDFKELKGMDWKSSLKEAKINFDLNEISNKKLQKLQKFIKGLWLEDYLFDFLTKYKKEINFDDVVMNLEKKDENNKTLVEMDIVLTKGYDVYLFSCSTGYKKGDIKHKALEAYKRSEDIGGIGAKSITVSLADKKTIKAIYKDDIDTYIGKNKPDLIGREELENEELLLQRLKEIIKWKDISN